MKRNPIPFGAGLIFLVLAGCSSGIREKAIAYTSQPWPPQVWKSEPPQDCPFEPSRDIRGIAFTHNFAAYTDADTWYPSWASDGNMYSGWTDGERQDHRRRSSVPDGRVPWV